MLIAALLSSKAKVSVDVNQLRTTYMAYGTYRELNLILHKEWNSIPCRKMDRTEDHVNKINQTHK